ncbi:unnamed protein product [Auanema sp. JU1783]|nr:unnamed protein product [Auanema sp. JU1783]
MDEGKIVLIGNESDVLHCGYSYPIMEGDKRYPSATHYTHTMILSQLGLKEEIVADLLSEKSEDVPSKAHQLLLDNMPFGHDMNSLASYLVGSRQSYMLIAMRRRMEQDPEFEKALIDTRDALLIVCDKGDKELGIGFDESGFVEWMKREKTDYAALSFWMRNEAARPGTLGANVLGFLLMYLRGEAIVKKRNSMLMRPAVELDGISMDNDDKPLRITACDLVISLEGIFRPLSNYYALSFEMKNEVYRSVEHYAYIKLFDALKLSDKSLEKIRTTVNPVDVPVVAERVFRKLNLTPEQIESKRSKMDRWRQSAMKHKITQYDYLRQLLLSTGDAIIVDCTYGEPMWTCAAPEDRIQKLLTKSKVNPSKLVDWMRNKSNKDAKAVYFMSGNKTGLLLMELRGKLASNTIERIPLATPMPANFAPMITQHLVCFTPESVWSPLYPAEIKPGPDQPPLPSPAHYVAMTAAKYLGFNQSDTDYVMETNSSLECWQRLHETIEFRDRDMERVQSWFMERRQKAIKEALQLLLEQHAALLRALLDTGDALLVYCCRFSSAEAELSIGMRETDLRVWMHELDISTSMLLDISSRPMAFRPPYLGGNKLGMILMQLRRDFCLRGVYPQTLPELPISVDVVLGTDSPLENMIVSVPFDMLDHENYKACFINPLYLLAKHKGDPDLMNAAKLDKLPPRFVTIDDAKIEEIMEKLDNCAVNTPIANIEGKPKIHKILKAKEVLMSVEPEDLRAVFIRLCARLRTKVMLVEQQHRTMNRISNEVIRLQAMRRGLEDTKDKSRERATGGRERDFHSFHRNERDRERDRENRNEMHRDRDRNRQNREIEQREPPRENVVRRPIDRGEFKVPNRKPRSEISKLPRRDQEKRQRSPSVKDVDREKKEAIPPAKRDKPTPLRSSAASNAKEIPIISEKSSDENFEKAVPLASDAVAVQVPPKAPKAPRPADEELSDGEILSSDED